MRSFLARTVRLADSASLFLTNVAAIVLLALVALTVADVIGRYFFNSPVTGTVELVRILMAGIIFLSVPLMFLRNDHIIVDLIPFVRQGWLAWLISIVLLAITAYVAFRVADRTWDYAVRAFEDNDFTEYLMIPRWPVVGLISGALFTAAVMSLLRLLLVLSTPGEVQQENHEDGI